MHFTKKLNSTFFENIFRMVLYLVISISPLTKSSIVERPVHTVPEFSEAWKYFETVEKGTREIVRAVGSSTKIRAPDAFHLRENANAFLGSIDPDPTLIEFSLRVSTRDVCGHACASARPRANACTLVIVVYTHVRVVRGVVLRPPPLPPQPIWLPPFPRCNWRTIQFPSRLPPLPACPLCYTWSPPVRSVLSPSRGSLPLAPFTPHPSDVTRSLTILCSRHWP